MKEQKRKKTFPTEANTSGDIGVRAGLSIDKPFNHEERYAGHSVDGHKELENVNED